VTTNQFSRAGGLSRNWITISLFSALLLIPCFWQSRVQSADLASHAYNAWLAGRIEAGQAPGLSVSPQSTNVLFDLMLQRLMVRVGGDWAQRLAVSACVLVFGWGAIWFLFRASGRNWWFAGPCVAMLAYGYIFQMGFFNFYLSLGLCLWYLAITWKRIDSEASESRPGKAWRIHIVAAPLLLVAWMAHPVPVVWAVGTAVYATIANSLPPYRRPVLLAFGLAALVGTRFVATHRYLYTWSFDQFVNVTGASQIALFGWKYTLPLAGLLLIWAVLFCNLARRDGTLHLVSTIPIQLWILNAFAVALMPNLVLLPQYGQPVGYIAQRFSLMAGIMACTVLGAAPATRVVKTALPCVAVLFFVFLYVDERKLNSMEHQIEAAVSRLPAGARVITELESPSLRSLCLYHDLDRACIGHCYSYANYEASSKQFRIRALPGNRIVLNNTAEVEAVADGRYVARPGDLPLYVIYPCGQASGFCSRPLQAGDTEAEPR
jgi:hypothetical protein